MLHLGLYIVGDDRPHAAASRGEGHLDVHVVAVFGAVLDLAVVDQAQIHHVHRNFRVVAVAQGFPHLVFVHRAVFRGLEAAFQGLLAQRVGVVAFNTGQVAVHRHGKVPPRDWVMVTKVSDGIMISVPEGTSRASTSRFVSTTSRSCMLSKTSVQATVKLSPHPHSAVALGLRKRNREFTPSVTKSISMPFTRGRCSCFTYTSTPSMVKMRSSDSGVSTHWVSYLKPEQPLFLMARRMPLASGFLSSCLRTCLTAVGVMVTFTVFGVKTSAVMFPPPQANRRWIFCRPVNNFSTSSSVL